MLIRYDPKGPQFRRLGRHDPRETACELWWSGSGLRFALDAAQLEVECDVPDDAHTPWLAVTVDGAPVARFPLMPGRHRYAALGSMERGVTHDIALLRDTQPTDSDTAPLRLSAVYTDGVPTAPASRPRLIEFLGDSLTVGEGAVGPRDAMEWRMAWISNQFAFPTLVSDALDAEKRVVALGGWGAHISFDGDLSHTIGHIYDRLCPIVPGGDVPFDFAAQRPADAVVVNLGTNDASGLSKRPGGLDAAAMAAFEDSAAALLALIRLRNPGAFILWAYGLMGNPLEAPLLRAVARRRAAGDGRVAYLALADCGSDLGSRGHPSRAAHRRAAAQIAAALKEWV